MSTATHTLAEETKTTLEKREIQLNRSSIKALPVTPYDETSTQDSAILSQNGEWLLHIHSEKSEVHIYHIPEDFAHSIEKGRGKFEYKERSEATQIPIKVYPLSRFLQKETQKHDAFPEEYPVIHTIHWSYGDKPVIFVTLFFPDNNDAEKAKKTSLFVIDPHQDIIKKISDDNTDFSYLAKISQKYPNVVLFTESNIKSTMTPMIMTFSYNIKTHCKSHLFVKEHDMTPLPLPSVLLLSIPVSSLQFDDNFNLKLIVSARSNQLDIFEPKEIREKITKEDVDTVFSTTFQEPEEVEIENYSDDYETIYLLDNRRSKFKVLKALDVKTGDCVTVKKHPGADIQEAIFRSDDKGTRLLGYIIYHENLKIIPLDNLSKDDQLLIEMTCRSYPSLDPSLPLMNFYCLQNGNRVAVTDMENPGKIMICDIHQGVMLKLFCIDNGVSPLVYQRHTKTEPLIYKTRDGLDLVCYLKTPKKSEKPVPVVVTLHGGPHSRDHNSFNLNDAILVDRGVATLRINFRGSSGFGIDHSKKGEGAWGREVLEDVETVLKDLIEKSIIDPKRMIVSGYSYGGYEALAALTFKPHLFIGAVVGGMEADLLEVFEAEPNEATRNHYCKQVLGHSSTHSGVDIIGALRARSPYHHADKIKAPILMFTGEKDSIISYGRQTLRMATRLTDLQKAVTLVTIKNEGHQILNPRNVDAVAAITEAFIGQTLGIEVAPIADELAEATDLDITFGAQHIKALHEKLCAIHCEKLAKMKASGEVPSSPSELEKILLFARTKAPKTLRDLIKEDILEFVPLGDEQDKRDALLDLIIDYLGPTGYVG